MKKGRKVKIDSGGYITGFDEKMCEAYGIARKKFEETYSQVKMQGMER